MLRFQLKLRGQIYSKSLSECWFLVLSPVCNPVLSEPIARGGHFNFICTGVCDHRIGKLAHRQIKTGQKTDPFSDYLQ